MNSLEYQFASKIKWNLHVQPDEMESYRRILSFTANDWPEMNPIGAKRKFESYSMRQLLDARGEVVSRGLTAEQKACDQERARLASLVPAPVAA